jgi:hypothetical protein
MKTRDVFLQFTRAVGAAIAYGFLAAFLWLVGMQIYGWCRTGDWTHIGVSDGLRKVLVRCCVKDGDSGHFAALLHWLDTPVDWLGMHKVIEVLPASLALFAVSILGNCISIYCRDRIDEHRRAG